MAKPKFLSAASTSVVNPKSDHDTAVPSKTGPLSRFGFLTKMGFLKGSDEYGEAGRLLRTEVPLLFPNGLDGSDKLDFGDVRVEIVSRLILAHAGLLRGKMSLEKPAPTRRLARKKRGRGRPRKMPLLADGSESAVEAPSAA